MPRGRGGLMYLLDTNALSEPLRLRPHPRFLEEVRRSATDALFTSTVCVMELRYGCARRGDPGLWARIEREVLARVDVLPFGREEAVVAGDLLAALQRGGQSIGIEDVQIAATALTRSLTIVTANEAHFSRIPGLQCVNWMR
jgi:tRNA(fMet)-specific endonuclease VapC